MLWFCYLLSLRDLGLPLVWLVSCFVVLFLFGWLWCVMFVVLNSVRFCFVVLACFVDLWLCMFGGWWLGAVLLVNVSDVDVWVFWQYTFSV